jgi:hypothetical protein
VSEEGAGTRKELLVALLSFLSLLPVVAGAKKDLQQENLTGPARTVRIEAARFSQRPGQQVEEPHELVAIITYNPRGQKTDVVSGPTGTGVVWRFENIPHDKTLYTYNAQGSLVEEVSYNPDSSLLRKTLYTYDDKGNLIETVSYGSDGSLLGKAVHTYDAQGHLTEAVSYDAFGVIAYKTVYAYDDKGNLTEETVYGAGGSPISRSVHTYDAQGRRIEMTHYDLAHGAGLGIDRTVETYDTQGNILELTTYYTEKAGDPEERQVPPPSKIIYTYEWDTHGNWVKQTETRCTSETGTPICEPSLVTYRTITYY